MREQGRYSPRLNMAIPSPASERMEMDLATTAGMEMCHLHAATVHHPLGVIY